MSLVATCACGKAFKAKPELAGKRVKCPACGGAIQIPAAAAPADDPLGLGDWSQAQAAPSPLAQPTASPLMAAPTPAVRAKAGAGVPRGVYIGLGIGGGVLVLGIVAWLGISAILSAARSTPETAQKTEAPAPPPAPPAPAKPADTWITYKSAAGGYAVQVPAQPVENRQDVSVGGLTMGLVAASVDQGPKGLYTTMHADMPTLGVDIDPKLILQGGWETVIPKQWNVQKSEVRDVTVNGMPGKEGELEGVDRGQPFWAKARVIASSKRVYGLLWKGPPAARSDSDLQRFFSSYQLPETAPAQPATPPAGLNLADLLNPSADRPLRQLAQMTEDERKAAYRMVVLQENLYRKMNAGPEGMAKTGDKQIDEQMQGYLKATDDSVWTQIGRLVNLSKEDAQAVKKEGDEKQWPKGP